MKKRTILICLLLESKQKEILSAQIISFASFSICFKIVFFLSVILILYVFMSFYFVFYRRLSGSLCNTNETNNRIDINFIRIKICNAKRNSNI